VIGLEKKADYVVICDCGIPKPIPTYIFQNYISKGIDYVYCNNCREKMVLPEYVMKLALDNE
jgi:hypothetical protein